MMTTLRGALEMTMVCVIAFCAGLRICEILGLLVDDLVFFNNTVTKWALQRLVFHEHSTKVGFPKIGSVVLTHSVVLAVFVA